jgi:hypothetical protein
MVRFPFKGTCGPTSRIGTRKPKFGATHGSGQSNILIKHEYKTRK